MTTKERIELFDLLQHKQLMACAVVGVFFACSKLEHALAADQCVFAAGRVQMRHDTLDSGPVLTLRI
jgi:hypothetical protein